MRDVELDVAEGYFNLRITLNKTAGPTTFQEISMLVFTDSTSLLVAMMPDVRVLATIRCPSFLPRYGPGHGNETSDNGSGYDGVDMNFTRSGHRSLSFRA
jgi:hypothetical protein